MWSSKPMKINLLLSSSHSRKPIRWTWVVPVNVCLSLMSHLPHLPSVPWGSQPHLIDLYFLDIACQRLEGRTQWEAVLSFSPILDFTGFSTLLNQFPPTQWSFLNSYLWECLGLLIVPDTNPFSKPSHLLTPRMPGAPDCLVIPLVLSSPLLNLGWTLE